MSSRQKKYPNTDTFEYYNAKPKRKIDYRLYGTCNRRRAGV